LEQLRPTEQTSTYAILNVLRENCSPPYGASRPCGIWIVARLLFSAATDQASTQVNFPARKPFYTRPNDRFIPGFVKTRIPTTREFFARIFGVPSDWTASEAAIPHVA
jgi:hypothetical protein